MDMYVYTCDIYVIFKEVRIHVWREQESVSKTVVYLGRSMALMGVSNNQKPKYRP